MQTDPTREANDLLAALIDAANAYADATALLHERVTLHRLDGTSISGRDAVADAIVNRGSEAVFSVVGSHAEGLHVALRVSGVPGHLVFTMSGTTESGRLTEIWMDAEA